MASKNESTEETFAVGTVLKAQIGIKPTDPLFGLHQVKVLAVKVRSVVQPHYLIETLDGQYMGEAVAPWDKTGFARAFREQANLLCERYKQLDENAPEVPRKKQTIFKRKDAAHALRFVTYSETL